jgi:hypothetical protein
VLILCSGESNAALRRAAGLCDGWIGTACTLDAAGGDIERYRGPIERFAETLVAESR